MRKEYLNTNNGKIYTELMLQMTGAPVNNPELLAMGGIYLVEHPEVSYDRYMETMQLVPDRTFDDTRKVFIQPYQAVDLPEEQQLENMKRYANERVKEVLQGADDAVSHYLDSYSDLEKLTFPQQRAEADAYAADPNATTPLLDDLAIKRGIARNEMIAKTIAKVHEFDDMSKNVVGQSQAYKAQIAAIVDDVAKTPKERYQTLRAMSFTYGG